MPCAAAYAYYTRGYGFSATTTAPNCDVFYYYIHIPNGASSSSYPSLALLALLGCLTTGLDIRIVNNYVFTTVRRKPDSERLPEPSNKLYIADIMCTLSCLLACIVHVSFGARPDRRRNSFISGVPLPGRSDVCVPSAAAPSSTSECFTVAHSMHKVNYVSFGRSLLVHVGRIPFIAHEHGFGSRLYSNVARCVRTLEWCSRPDK